MTLFLFSFTASWNNFYGALVMLNDKDLYPVSLGLHMWNISTTESPEMYSLAITGSLVAVVPLLIAFLCLQRFWRSGLTTGAVKWPMPAPRPARPDHLHRRARRAGGASRLPGTCARGPGTCPRTGSSLPFPLT